MFLQKLFNRKDAVDKILDALDSDGVVDTGSKLAKLGEPAVERLIDKLKTASGEERASIVYALRWIADRRAIPVLIGLLRDSDENVRRIAADALSVFSDPSAIEPLTLTLTREDEVFATRRAAAKSLLELGWTAVTPQHSMLLTILSLDPVLGRVLPYKNDEAIIQDLRQYGELASFHLLMALAATERFVRRSAAEALGELGGQEAIPSLTEAATADSDFDTRRAAAIALEKIQTRYAPRKAVAFPSAELGIRDVIAASPSDVIPGMMIRIWHEMLHEWATDWLEVVSVTGDNVIFHTRSGEIVSRNIGDTTRSAFRLP